VTEREENGVNGETFFFFAGDFKKSDSDISDFPVTLCMYLTLYRAVEGCVKP
jgi:hypothetical protein